MEHELINDGVPMWLALKGKDAKTRAVTDDKEFFLLLKKKVLADIERIFSHTEIEKKANSVVDALVDMEEFENYITGECQKRGIDYNDLKERRINLIGRFEKKFVMTEVVDGKAPVQTFADKKNRVLDYAIKNEWPAMILKRDDNGKPFKILGAGKTAWDNAIAWDANSPILQDNFNDLYEAVLKNDKKEE